MNFNLQNYSKKTFKRVPLKIWILMAIMLVGIFFRAYNFHEWLDFGSDQVKDINVVNSVVVKNMPWPSYGPDMSHSGAGGHSRRFLLGPMYYYFEIISALIFGNYPDKLAYPDLLFAILSIPLLYYFLRRYFEIYLSLCLTGLYAISYYALSFSHSAWNVNSIPFFTLLFLLSLHELISSKEKTSWLWVVALGVSAGISIQLHAILLVLFPATLFSVSIIWLRKNLRVWKMLGVAVAIMFFLNLGQIITEYKTNYLNSKVFLISIVSPSKNASSTFAKFVSDVNCSVQANTHIISSIGSGTCEFSAVKVLRGDLKSKVIFSNLIFELRIVACLLFSLIGYWLLIYYYKKESDLRKKQFLGLLILYVVLSFLVMLPLEVGLLRYYVHTFFIPLFFFGFLAQYLISKCSRKLGLTLVGLLIIFLAVANLISINNAAKAYAAQSRTDLDIIVLGELESAMDYMIENSDNRREIYVSSDQENAIFLGSLDIVAKNRNVKLIKLRDDGFNLNSETMFYVGPNIDEMPAKSIERFPIENYKNFGKVGIYKLKQ